MNTEGLIYDSGYNSWQINRVKFILETFGANFFSGKKILELGCYHGGVSKLIYNLVNGTNGSITAVEGLEENYNYCKATYPYINFVHSDLDSPDINDWIFDEHYDIIIHWGLLYHLQYPDKLFLETLIVDSDNLVSYVEEKNIWGTDQSIHNIGTRPNTKYVENIFSHLKFKRYDDSKLNSNCQPVYDWIPSNSGNIYRRFWVIDCNN
jgi:hypothetical protein